MNHEGNVPELGCFYDIKPEDVAFEASCGDFDLYSVALHATLGDCGASRGDILARWSPASLFSRALPPVGQPVRDLTTDRTGRVASYFIESGYLGVQLELDRAWLKDNEVLTQILIFGTEVVAIDQDQAST